MPADEPQPRLDELSALHVMCAGFRDNPKPSLVKLAGRAGGGGCELASSCDMRFGVRGKTILNQMEVPLGILPAGSGTQNLPRLIGRGRALEMILGADDIDADTAASWGYLNRLFDSVEEMNAFVDALAFRISAWPAYAVALAKQAVGQADPGWRQGLMEEHALGMRTLRHPEAKRSLRLFLESGGETPTGEMRIADLTHEVAAAIGGEAASESMANREI
jgi:enoyl-CoA hydratase/carnithine racemase